MDEYDAIHQLKQKDPMGLKWLVDQYYPRALQVAFLITGDLPMAEDVVQEEFLALYRSISRFDEKRPFLPWFTRCVVNLAVQTAQKSKKQVSLNSREASNPFDAIALDELSPEETVVSSEFKERVQIALNRLSPRQRAVVVQRYFLEMSEKEMADEMRIAPGTVKWLLNAARKKLRMLLNHERSDV